jgi:uncharacterized radical SAM protein YgiQ
MVSHYTANNKPRSNDDYSHGGEGGHRPDRALITYCNLIRRAFADAPIVIGGIEASLRRLAHYDYGTDTVRHSVLLDSKADLLVYGMGEHPLYEIAEKLRAGEKLGEIRGVRGTCWRTGREDAVPGDAIRLPAFEEVKGDDDAAKAAFARSYVLQEENTDYVTAKVLVEKSESRFVVQEPPALPLTTAEFDALYELPFTRRWHPMYDGPAANGRCGVPALEEVLFSLVSVRGCFGACSFCAIQFLQGVHIQVRSHASLLREAETLTKHPRFKGYIHDVGGPTANFRLPPCSAQETRGACHHRACLGSEPCPHLQADHRDYTELLRKLREVPGVKKVFVRSGIRFDYLMRDPNHAEFLGELCAHHVSGQLKVAPEHVSDRVLALVRKSSHGVYVDFAKEYAACNKALGMKQYLVPYFIASLPGATVQDAVENMEYLKKTGFVPDQVQDFYPTPGTLATCMYHTGLDPHTGEALHVPKGHERALHRALLQFNKPENAALVREALSTLPSPRQSR